MPATWGWSGTPSTRAQGQLAGGDAYGAQAAVGAGGTDSQAQQRRASLRGKVEHPFPLREASLRLREGPPPEVGEEPRAPVAALGFVNPLRATPQLARSRKRLASRDRVDQLGGERAAPGLAERPGDLQILA